MGSRYGRAEGPQPNRGIDHPPPRAVGMAGPKARNQTEPRATPWGNAPEIPFALKGRSNANHGTQQRNARIESMIAKTNRGWDHPFRADRIGVGRTTQGVALGSVWWRAFGPAIRTAHGGGGSIHGVWLRAFGPAIQTARGSGKNRTWA